MGIRIKNAVARIRSDSDSRRVSTYPDSHQVEGLLRSHQRMGLVAANLVNLRTHCLPEFSLYLVGGSQGTECGLKYVMITQYQKLNEAVCPVRLQRVLR